MLYNLQQYFVIPSVIALVRLLDLKHVTNSTLLGFDIAQKRTNVCNFNNILTLVPAGYIPKVNNERLLNCESHLTTAGIIEKSTHTIQAVSCICGIVPTQRIKIDNIDILTIVVRTNVSLGARREDKRCLD